MKRNLRKLQLLSKIIDLNYFYTVSIWNDGIYFQGEYNSSLCIKLKSLRFKSDVDTNGHIVFNRFNIRITLTQ